MKKRHTGCLGLLLAVFLVLSDECLSQQPLPLLSANKPVGWWFVFKFNAGTFPGCDGEHACPFGGSAQNYALSQQFVYASSDDRTLRKGKGCLGSSTSDPVGATFDEIYNGAFYYVVWNDQFYSDPEISGCGDSCGGPWGHSKGLLAWNEAGEGVVMQVTTPSWPAAGSKDYPRQRDGNTLGCVLDDDVKVSQDFFALKLSKSDVLKVLTALANASVVTEPGNSQIVRKGGPQEIQDKVAKLGVQSKSRAYTRDTLSSGVVLISKPSKMYVPPWQMVSAVLGGVPLRAATWWTTPKIYSTTQATEIGCWDASLSKPGAVEIALKGQWDNVTIGLAGGPGSDRNHAKVGVSTSGAHRYVILGDMNQQGALWENYARAGQKCSSSQNGRGGLFYVIDDPELAAGVANLIQGDSAPTNAPAH